MSSVGTCSKCNYLCGRFPLFPLCFCIHYALLLPYIQEILCLLILIPGNDQIFLNPSTASVLEENVTIRITLNANPPPDITVDRVDGMPIRDKGTRVTIGDAFIVFRFLNESDATNYTVKATNRAAVQTAAFSLSCEFQIQWRVHMYLYAMMSPSLFATN